MLLLTGSHGTVTIPALEAGDTEFNSPGPDFIVKLFQEEEMI